VLLQTPLGIKALLPIGLPAAVVNAGLVFLCWIFNQLLSLAASKANG
jgi:hypothetical protein